MSTHQFTELEEELRYWLANEDWYTSAYTRQWLERTPPAEAADLLADIARDAEPEPRSLWSTFVIGFATAGFLPTGGGKINARKAGIRAALLLASLDDPRCVAPLLRVFETDKRWQNKYQESIETALMGFLARAGDHPELGKIAVEIRALAERIWQSGGTRSELSPSMTNLLSAALRFLQSVGGEPEIALIRTIAASDARTPNRKWAREKAELLLAV